MSFRQSNFSSVKSVYGGNAIDKALASGLIIKQDKDLITEFVAEKKAAANISPGRANKYTYTLLGWRRFLGPYAQLSIGDVYSGIELMKNSPSSRDYAGDTGTNGGGRGRKFTSRLAFYLNDVPSDRYESQPESHYISGMNTSVQGLS